MSRAMRYVRTQRKPFVLEAMVSRLHGHSSSSGAQRNFADYDCVAGFEQTLIDAGAIDADGVQTLRDEAKAEADAAADAVATEPRPTAFDVYMGTYAPSAVDAVYPKDYTGLPKRKT
jgi:2-oxoisovalerate dehydrogenase E1 component alpha subunit